MVGRRSASSSRSRRCCPGRACSTMSGCRSGCKGDRRAERRRRPSSEMLERVHLDGFRECRAARTVRRHEDARVDRPRAGHQAARAPDGRAVCGTRRDHPLQAQQRSARALAGRALHRRLRHPQRLRKRLPVQPHRRHGGAAGPRVRRNCDRRGLSARRSLPHLARLCSALPAGFGRAGGCDHTGQEGRTHDGH